MQDKKELLKISITIISIFITIAIKPIVTLYSRVQVLEERMNNRKNDINKIYSLIDKNEIKIYDNHKQLYISIGDLRERISKVESKK